MISNLDYCLILNRCYRQQNSRFHHNHDIVDCILYDFDAAVVADVAVVVVVVAAVVVAVVVVAGFVVAAVVVAAVAADVAAVVVAVDADAVDADNAVVVADGDADVLPQVSLL